jgi:hypothetical protein
MVEKGYLGSNEYLFMIRKKYILMIENPSNNICYPGKLNGSCWIKKGQNIVNLMELKLH